MKIAFALLAMMGYTVIVMGLVYLFFDFVEILGDFVASLERRVKRWKGKR